MGYFSILLEPRLIFIVVASAFLSLLSTMSVASRPAAVLTGRVQLATSVSQIFFMVSRLANLFYLPLMASFVDRAVARQQTDHLQVQILSVILGSALGAFVSWFWLGNFVSLYRYGIASIEEFGSAFRAIRAHLSPRLWGRAWRAFRDSTPLATRLFRLDGIDADFLLSNVFATAVWTVGALSAIYVSGQYPAYKSTAVLLSGLVNSFAAIAFSVWVDPKAALITDRVLSGSAPQQQINTTAYHLAFGNFVGSLGGLIMFFPGTALISAAAQSLGSQGQSLTGGLWVVVLLNVVVTMLASTTYASRISAVLTGQVATALTVYNLFFLVTRLAGQVYAPVLGSMCDHMVAQGPQGLPQLEAIFRRILFGASAGALLGLLLLPTFVEIYNRAVWQLKQRGSMPAVLLACLHPRAWIQILSCLRFPSLMGVRPSHFGSLPKGFLIGNVLVISIHTVGVMAAIYAGAALGDKWARTATLLSSVVNGLATITLSVVVDPTISLISDRAVKNERPRHDVTTMAVGLMGGMLIGTLLSQIFFSPAVWVISQGALLLSRY